MGADPVAADRPARLAGVGPDDWRPDGEDDRAMVTAWERFKKAALARWPRLTDAELDFCLANDRLLISLIESRYSLARRQVQEDVREVQTAVIHS